jgi:tetratricopeptide (TPR) repeat protein
MNEIENEKDRRIIPRWRNSRKAKNSREINSIYQNHDRNIDFSFLKDKQFLWENDKNLINAIEYVTAAYIQESYSDCIPAAQSILETLEFVHPQVLKIAEEILIKTGKINISTIATQQEINLDKNVIYSKIHALRNCLSKFPRNAIFWSDLAQSYTNIGLSDQAKKSMQIALSISPDNRYILRCATRMYIHFDEPDRANKLLLSRPITKFDPWLLAAEIATSTVEGKTSQLLNHGKKILEQQRFLPFHISELAGAIGTIELQNGSLKKAKKLFQLSLLDPSENSVAQSIWAKRNIESLNIEEAIRKTPRIFEAQAYKAFLNMEWDAVIENCKSWLFEEPFSSRPAIIGSIASSTGTEDFVSSEIFCRFALIANPTEHMLKNNLAFSLANLGKLDEAQAIIDEAFRNDLAIQTKIALTATEGLINFRKGIVQDGITKYIKAITMSEENLLPDYKLRASIYYSREMIKARLFSKQDSIDFCEPLIRNVNDPITIWLYERRIKSILDK